MLTAVLVTAAVVNRAVSGVGGESRRQQRIAFLSFAAGLVAVYAIEGGLRAAGASIGTVDLIGASGPILGRVSAASSWRQGRRCALSSCPGAPSSGELS